MLTDASKLHTLARSLLDTEELYFLQEGAVVPTLYMFMEHGGGVEDLSAVIGRDDRKLALHFLGRSMRHHYYDLWGAIDVVLLCAEVWMRRMEAGEVLEGRLRDDPKRLEGICAVAYSPSLDHIAVSLARILRDADGKPTHLVQDLSEEEAQATGRAFLLEAFCQGYAE